jgi:signal transduction histidine kinase
VSLQLEAISNRLRHASEPPESDLRRVRRQLEDALYETRHAVWALRSPILKDLDLASALSRAAKNLIGPRNIRFDIEVHGGTLRFAQEVEQQLLRIGHEAIANAVYHSECSRIRTELAYEPQGLQMTVADNGRGFDPGTQTAASGHFGLAGMRYRAQQLGADLIVSSSQAGTRVVLTLRDPGKRSRLQQLRMRIAGRRSWPAATPSDSGS